jgi:hypothetical protein
MPSGTAFYAGGRHEIFNEGQKDASTATSATG